MPQLRQLPPRASSISERTVLPITQVASAFAEQRLFHGTPPITGLWFIGVVLKQAVPELGSATIPAA